MSIYDAALPPIFGYRFAISVIFDAARQIS
jgi:hypothetical protein